MVEGSYTSIIPDPEIDSFSSVSYIISIHSLVAYPPPFWRQDRPTYSISHPLDLWFYQILHLSQLWFRSRSGWCTIDIPILRLEIYNLLRLFIAYH